MGKYFVANLFFQIQPCLMLLACSQLYIYLCIYVIFAANALEIIQGESKWNKTQVFFLYGVYQVSSASINARMLSTRVLK